MQSADSRDKQEQPPKLSVALVLLPEFTLSTFSAFVDVLRLASDKMDDSRQRLCRWTIVGPDLTPVKSSCGVRITPDQVFDDPANYDYIIVCGGLIKGHEAIAPAIYDYLRLADKASRRIVGLCTGSFALAAAGLLQYHKACIHWVHAAAFSARYPEISVDNSTLYLTQGRYTTCSGGLAAASLATRLVAKHCGLEQAHKVMTGLGIETYRSGRTSQHHQGAGWFRRIRSQRVRRAILLMSGHIQQSLSVEEIARQLDISPSTLERAFKDALGCSPATFDRLLRLAYGRWELLHSDKPITAIANDVGFADSSHFCQWYKRLFGTTPKKDRLQAGGSQGKGTAVKLCYGDLPPVFQEMLAGDLLLFDQSWLKQQMQVLH